MGGGGGHEGRQHGRGRGGQFRVREITTHSPSLWDSTFTVPALKATGRGNVRVWKPPEASEMCHVRPPTPASSCSSLLALVTLIVKNEPVGLFSTNSPMQSLPTPGTAVGKGGAAASG